MRQKKTAVEITAEREIGRNLEIYLTNLGHLGGSQVSKKKFADAFGFTVHQVQGWFGINGEGMPASALYRIFEKGQSIDALLREGRVTITKEQLAGIFPAAQELNQEQPVTASELLDVGHSKKRPRASKTFEKDESLRPRSAQKEGLDTDKPRAAKKRRS